jgi:WD40 repeat protein
MKYEDIAHHIQSDCVSVQKRCIYQDYGCDFVGVSTTLTKHLEDCSYHKLRAFIKLMSQRVANLESMVLEQQNQITKLRSRPNSRVPSEDGMAEEEIEEQEPTPSIVQPNWVTHGMECLKTISSQGTGITSLEYERNGKLFAGTYDGMIKVFDCFSGNLLESYQGHQLSVWSLTLDEHQKRLFSGGSDGLLNVWDFNQASTPIHSFNPSQGKLYSLMIHHNRLYTASSDHSIHIWDANSYEKLGTLQGHSGGVNSIKIVNDKLISASTDKSIKVFVVNVDLGYPNFELPRYHCTSSQ